MKLRLRGLSDRCCCSEGPSKPAGVVAEYAPVIGTFASWPSMFDADQACSNGSDADL